MPTLDRLQANRGGADFEVVTISLDRTAEEAEAFFEENTIHNLPAWHDGTFSLNARLVLPGLPTSIFYDSQGFEVARIPGEVDWMSEEALALINKLTEE
jgi:thioredoxin-related protein